MNTTQSIQPELVEGIVVVHGAMRRDAARLPAAIGRAVSVDDARAIARWFLRFEREVEHHHLREDEVVWPMLLERAPEFREPLGQLEADHHALDEAMARCRLSLADLVEGADDAARAAAIESAVALQDLLGAHLDREEAAAFPLFVATFTPESFAALEQQLLKATPKRLIAFEIPFALDGLPVDVVNAKLAELPVLIRVLHRRVWSPRYDRLVAPLVAAG